MDLSPAERRLAELCAARFERPYFRWSQHLIWLSVPIIALLFWSVISQTSAATKPSASPQPFRLDPLIANLLTAIGVMCMFNWYVVFTTRVIGKLQRKLSSHSSP